MERASKAKTLSDSLKRVEPYSTSDTPIQTAQEDQRAKAVFEKVEHTRTRCRERTSARGHHLEIRGAGNVATVQIRTRYTEVSDIS